MLHACIWPLCYYISAKSFFFGGGGGFFCLFFVALRPMSAAMVIAGRSVPLTTLFPGQA